MLSEIVLTLAIAATLVLLFVALSNWVSWRRNSRPQQDQIIVSIGCLLLGAASFLVGRLLGIAWITVFVTTFQWWYLPLVLGPGFLLQVIITKVDSGRRRQKR